MIPAGGRRPAPACTPLTAPGRGWPLPDAAELTMTGPALADVQREHPGWRCWQGWRVCYAVRADVPYRRCYQLKAATPAALRDQIQAAEQDPATSDLPLTILGPPFGPNLPPGPCGHPLPGQGDPE